MHESKKSAWMYGQAGKFVQISPQRVRLKLRKNVQKRVRFKVAHAKQYPVDLYYLMDLSNSMVDDRDNIVSILIQTHLITTLLLCTSGFFWHFYGRGCSFEVRKLEFFLQILEFFPQGPWVYSKTLKFWRFRVSFLKKWLFLVENWVKMHQILHFLAHLHQKCWK